MAGITVSGLSSGIDYDTLVDQLLLVERAPINRLETQQSTYAQKQATYTDLIGLVDSLESAAKALRSSTGFAGKSATISNETVFTANVSTSATTGSYQLTVNQLAQEHHLVSGNGLAAEDGLVASGAGEFRFKVGDTGTEYTVAVDATTTLEELKDALNALVDGDGDPVIKAAIVNEGTGATPYKLILSTIDQGAAQKIIVTQDDTNLGYPVNDTTLASALHVQKPQDAEIELNGLTVYRAANTVSDLVPGVTLFLHQADPEETVSLQVEIDREGVKDKIQGLIDSYNDVVEFVKLRDTYNQESQERGVLYAEGTARSLLQSLGRAVSTGVEGLPQELKALSQIGVSTSLDGTLTLNEGTLSDALDEDYEGVMDLFIDGDETTGIGEQLYQLASQATRGGDGLLTTRVDGLKSGIRDLGQKIDEKELALDRYEVRLRAQFAALESLISSFQGQDVLLSDLGG